MKRPLINLLLFSSLCYAHEEVTFHTTQVTIAPQVPQWAPPVTDDEGIPLAPCRIEVTAPINDNSLHSLHFPPTSESILCNIRFKGSLTDGSQFNANQPTIYNIGNSIGLSFVSQTPPKSSALRLNGTLRYEIRTGAETEKTPAVTIKGRGEYKTAGYLIHYLPDAGEGTKQHTFMVMPPDRTAESATAIVDIIFKDKNGKIWSLGNGSLTKESTWYTADSVCFTSNEKIEADHGSLQIVLRGKAKTYKVDVNQALNLIPAQPPAPHISAAKQVQLRHVKTEFNPNPKAPEEDRLCLTWQQCYSPLHQAIRDALDEAEGPFPIVDATFTGSVTDENGCKIPLKAGSVEYSPDVGFIANLVNKEQLPTGLKLHVKGTLEFVACNGYNTEALPPVTVRKGSSTKCGVYTIEYFSKKLEDSEDEDCIRVSVDAIHSEKLKSIRNIKVTGTDSVSRDFNAPNSILFCVFSEAEEDCETEEEQLPDVLEVSLLRLIGGQRYTCTIDQIIDLSKSK